MVSETLREAGANVFDSSEEADEARYTRWTAVCDPSVFTAWWDLAHVINIMLGRDKYSFYGLELQSLKYAWCYG